MQHMDFEQGRRTLLAMAHLLDSLHVPFFLIQGTALGAYRDKGFTPTERDIDIGVLIEDFVPAIGEIVSILARNGCQMEIYSLPFSGVRALVVWAEGIHVDIAGWMPWKDKRFVATPVHPTITEPYAIVHDRRLIENYQTVEMFGRHFKVPSPIETYLEREYGDWRTPREDHVSRTRVYDFLEKEGIPDDLLGT